MQTNDTPALTLVLTATGKTGRRVADRLEERGLPVRRASRSAAIPFDWDEPSTWDANLEGVRAVYVVYSPDLSVPSAPPAIEAFTRRAAAHGVEHLVLLSGRGEEEAQRCERIVQESGLAWTIVRAGWFNQNFSEGAFQPLVAAGTLALPAGEMVEPFVDLEDVADVVAAALTDPRHRGELYEVTGPRLMSFAEVAGELAAARGESVRYQPIAREAFLEELRAAGLTEDYVDLLDYLFATLLDGRNAHTTDGVQRALGRAPRDFSDYAREAAASGAWPDLRDEAPESRTARV